MGLCQGGGVPFSGSGMAQTFRDKLQRAGEHENTILHVVHLVFVQHRTCNSSPDVGRHDVVLGHVTHLWWPQVHRGTTSIELTRRNLLLHAIQRPPWEVTHHPRVMLRHIGDCISPCIGISCCWSAWGCCERMSSPEMWLLRRWGTCPGRSGCSPPLSDDLGLD